MRITLLDELDLAHWVTVNAKREGVKDVAVDISKSREVSVSFRDGKMDELKESTRKSMTLGIYVDNKYSSHTTNDMRRDSVIEFIKKAVAMTKYLGEDKYRQLPDPKYFQDMEYQDLQIRDVSYETIQSNQRVELARTLEEGGRQRSDKVISCTGEYGDNFTESLKVTTNGFVGEKISTSFYAYCDASIKDDQGNIVEGSDNTNMRHFEDLDNSGKISHTAVDRALRKIGQKKIASGVYDMIVINRRASRILGTVLRSLSGRSLQQKNSFLIDMLDNKIASDILTIVDDPFIPRGIGSRLYDREGMAAHKRSIIENGVLKSYLIDSYYGRKLGMEPTGGGTSNLILNYGEKSLDEMVAEMKRGILVTGFLGGSSNETTGDFSYGVNGFLIEDGKAIQPINEMNISGNFKDLLNRLTEIGNDPHLISSQRFASLKFEDVQFSGL
ncbi:MAG: TldD/PmbA family protein [candidate division Zixibacteria bacterium]